MFVHTNGRGVMVPLTATNQTGHNSNMKVNQQNKHVARFCKI